MKYNAQMMSQGQRRTILYSSAAIPGGRLPPSDSGMFSRLLGVGRYAPRSTSRESVPNAALKGLAEATQIMTFSVLSCSVYRRFAIILTNPHAPLAEICVWLELHLAGLTSATLLPVGPVQGN